jgi:uncharacterized protein (TIGR03382 family)
MFWVLLTQLTWANSVTVTVAVSDDGVEILDAYESTVRPIVTPGFDVEVIGDHGDILSVGGMRDPRLRSVIHPVGEGLNGDTTMLDRGVTRLQLPWAEGAQFLQTPLGQLVPGQLPPPGDIPALQVHGTGNPEERLDLLVLADGYTEAELGLFAEDVDTLMTHLFAIEPWASYSELVNVWRIDRPSSQSGASRDPAETFSPYGCYYGCNGLDRLICCDDENILAEADASLPASDGILVLVNDPEYGGSGGFNYAVSTARHADALQVATHELGHTLVGLWDEYSYGVPGDISVDGQAANCAADGAAVGWDEWMDVEGIDALPVCSFTNYYRPTEHSCMMNILQDRYCPVCRQESIYSIYARVPEIVSEVTPATGGTVFIGKNDDPFVFEFEEVGPISGLQYDWYVDQELVAEDTKRLDLACSGINGDLYLHVYDPTPWVRTDPYGLTWKIIGPWKLNTGSPCEGGCGCASPNPGMLPWLMLPLAGLLVRRRRNA